MTTGVWWLGRTENGTTQLTNWIRQTSQSQCTRINLLSLLICSVAGVQLTARTETVGSSQHQSYYWVANCAHGEVCSEQEQMYCTERLGQTVCPCKHHQTRGQGSLGIEWDIKQLLRSGSAYYLKFWLVLVSCSIMILAGHMTSESEGISTGTEHDMKLL